MIAENSHYFTVIFPSSKYVCCLPVTSRGVQSITSGQIKALMVEDKVTCQCFFGPDVLLCTRVSADDDSNRATNSKKNF